MHLCVIYFQIIWTPRSNYLFVYYLLTVTFPRLWFLVGGDIHLSVSFAFTCSSEAKEGEKVKLT